MIQVIHSSFKCARCTWAPTSKDDAAAELEIKAHLRGHGEHVGPMTDPTRETPFSAEDFELEAASWGGPGVHALVEMLTQAAVQQRALEAIVRDIEAGDARVNEIHKAAQAALRGTHGD